MPPSSKSYFPNTFTECLFVLSTTFAFSVSTIFSGLTTVMTSLIASSLHMPNAQIVWITSASLLTSGAFVLPLGTLSDTVGRKNLALTAMILTTLAVFAAGWAIDGTMLIIFTALMGLFSAAGVTPAVGQFGAVYRQLGKRRNRAFACFSAGNPLGFVVGTFVAGVVLQITGMRGRDGREGGNGWRVCFWVFAVLCAAFAGLVAWSVPSDERVRGGGGDGDESGSGSGSSDGSESDAASGRLSAWEVLKRFDLLGALLVTGGVSAVSAGLTLTGTAPQGWATPYVIVLLVLGVFLIGAFIFWQSIYKFPLMPLYIWKDRNFSLVIILLATGNAAFTASSFWLCLYLQRIQNLSALWIAIYLLPQNINGLIVNFVCSLILHRVSHRLLMGIGAVSYLASFLLLALMQPIRYYYWAFIFPSLVLAVVGADLQFNVANSYVMSSLPRSQQSLAGGILSAVNKLLSNIALSISTAVFDAGQKRVRAGSADDVHGFGGYRAAFWMLVGIAGVNLVLVPWVRIEKGVLEDEEPLRGGRVSDVDVESGVERDGGENSESEKGERQRGEGTDVATGTETETEKGVQKKEV
ncbi:major facilitator superfamily-domain-containing protein [Aspergillus stella-maris]|uniref:major facilitator superfamily-domain-containing protein n=1 Tax=Aspergillus stella-maris TaxID=1810926 RepID=UPI003CCD1939